MILQKTIKNIRIIFGVTLALLMVTTISLKAPDLHDSYIRTKVGNAVVKVLTADSGGTGFHVVAPSGNTYIMTNRHVCSGKAGDVLLVQTDSGKSIPRKIIGVYKDHDLCLLESLPGVKGITLGSELSVGDSIGIVGHPLLVPLTYMKGNVVGNPDIELVEAFNVTKEECSGKFIDVSNTMYVFFGINTVCMGVYKTQQVDYIAYQGNSGSPAVNGYGNLVGVHFAGRQDSITIGYIVPLSFVKAFLQDY